MSAGLVEIIILCLGPGMTGIPDPPDTSGHAQGLQRSKKK